MASCQCVPFWITDPWVISMIKLPATTKHLLKLRSPNPPLPPPIPKLNGVLRSTLLDAKRKNAETAWLVLTVRRQGNPGFALWTVSHQEYIDLHSVDRQPSHVCWPSLLFRDQERSGRHLNEVWPREGGQHRGTDA